MRRVTFGAITTLMAGLVMVTVWARDGAAVDVLTEASTPDALLQEASSQDPSAQDAARRSRCKRIHGDLVEAPSTTGCKPEHTSCFLGEVDANHGLRGTTYFKGDPGAVQYPPTAPTFRAYTGNFEYITPHGTIFMKEMGTTEPFTAANPQSGVVNAYQRIVEGTGEFEGATGYLFVSGFNRNQRVVTTVHGEICKA